MGTLSGFALAVDAALKGYMAAAAAPVLTAAPCPAAEFDLLVYFLPLLSE